MSAAPAQPRRRGLAGAVERLAVAWALAGGLVLLALVAINVWSVAAGALFGTPFPGDFELVEMGTAIAVFAFLPYGQLRGANVTADIFTMRAPPRAVAVFRSTAALAAVACSLVLLWRMTAGLGDHLRYRETTTILEIPHWIAFVPILASLALLALAATVTLAEAGREVRERGRARS